MADAQYGTDDRGTDSAHAHSGPASLWRDREAVRHTLADELLSLANLLGRPVVDPGGNRVARVSDVIVRWSSGVAHPPVVGLLVRIGKGLATVAVGDVTLRQSIVELQSERVTAALPTRQASDVALARDVLDHQLVDITGVEVVRAADVYLARRGSGWELAGVDIGLWALFRRALPKRRRCPVPDRALDWSDLQAFTPRFQDEGPPASAGPAAAAALSGSTVQMAYPATSLHKLRAKDVAGLLAGLDRDGRVQLAQLADSSTVAEALADLEPAKVDALLAELDEADQAKLRSVLRGATQ